MSYSTPASVRLALVPSSAGTLPATPTNTAADLSDTQLTDAIAQADSIIDGYLGGIYVTPVAAVDSAIPAPINYWSRDIAAYLATCTYRGQMDIQTTDPIALRYNATLTMLRDVAAGKMNLSLPKPGDNGIGAGAADTPINPYNGDLWQPDDFSLTDRQGWQPGWS